MDRNLTEICQRLDGLQDSRDQQRLALRQMSVQLTELMQKLDQLWAQCHHYFPQIKEHDVHFRFFRTSFENHKQQMLELADNFESTRSVQPAMGTELSPNRRMGVQPAMNTDLSPNRRMVSGETDDVDLASRARMLAQVMECLYA